MGRKNILKWIAPMCIGLSIWGVGNITPSSIVHAEEISTPAFAINASHDVVSLNNSNLRTAIIDMLGKTPTSTIYSDDFLNCDKFKSDAENPIYQLDFSNTGITDIRELAQFELPEHIKGINLAGNGITNEHLSAITQLIDSSIDDVIQITEQSSYVAKTDFSSQIKKVNLNDNNIELTETSNTYLNNNKLLFGIQCFGEIHKSGLIMPNENGFKPYYYIRSNIDENYLSFTLENDLSIGVDQSTGNDPDKVHKSYKVRDVVSPLVPEDLLDRYYIKVESLTNTSTAYFSGYTFEKEFTQFTISLDEDFRVERETLLNLKVSSDGKILSDSPINIGGFGNNSSLFVSYENASTNRATSSQIKNYVNITIKKGNAIREIPLEFIVEDTIEPVIRLKGSAHVYSSRGKAFNDPGYIAYDPSVKGAEDGEDLTPRVVVTSNLDVVTLGTYTITYVVTDLAGNQSEPMTRIVEIQESVLDNINLTVTSEKLVDGEDIVLIVQPDSNVDMSKYKDIKYYWYVNNKMVYSTTGEASTGKSSFTLIGDADKNQSVYVKLTATQVSDNAKIELISKSITLNVEKESSNNTIIIAVTIVILLILGGFITYSIIKYRKSKGKTHKKHKNFHKGKSPKGATENKNKGPEIQVIKDYKGDTTGSTTSGNGDNDTVNERPAEPQNNDNIKK